MFAQKRSTKLKFEILIIISTFIWVGLVIGISFIEAPLKFQARGITLELGLGIGKLVFHALNKAELLCMSTIILALFVTKPSTKIILFFSIPILVLVFQTIVLFPILDLRLEHILSGNKPEKSNVHFYYIILEVIKLLGLFLTGIYFLVRTIQPISNKT